MHFYQKLKSIPSLLFATLFRHNVSTDGTPVLVSVLPSLDAEHARWLLGHYQVHYYERPHAPPFSVYAIKHYGGTDRFSILITDDQLIDGQFDIPSHYEALVNDDLKLLPGDANQRQAVQDWIHFCGHHIAGPSFVWGYYNIVPHRALGLKMLTTDVPMFERIFYKLAYGMLSKALMRILNVNESSAQQSLERLRSTFDKADALLQDGRRFFFADRLTIADTIFAAYGAPVVLAPEYGGSMQLLPTLEQAPEAMRKVVEEFRARPAGQHILRLYREHRMGFDEYRIK